MPTFPRFQRINRNETITKLALLKSVMRKLVVTFSSAGIIRKTTNVIFINLDRLKSKQHFWKEEGKNAHICCLMIPSLLADVISSQFGINANDTTIDSCLSKFDRINKRHIGS